MSQKSVIYVQDKGKSAISGRTVGELVKFGFFVFWRGLWFGLGLAELEKVG